MQLALRTTHALGATWLQRLASRVIKARLVSAYCHGGIVINGDLYHATAADGLARVPAGQWSPQRWVLLDVPAADSLALAAFAGHQGARYDWLSLLAFVGPRVRDSTRFYCFEWCWLAMTGRTPLGRVTPEMLLEQCLQACVARGAQ